MSRPTVGWTFTGIVLALMIGLRVEVGGDWFNYLFSIEKMGSITLSEAFRESDPGYRVLSWLSYNFGWGVYGVNLFSGALFAVGLTYFCRHLSRPWLALTVSIPYMVIVVGMGYSRQAVALGLAMLGLVALLRKQSIPWFLFWVVLGATFHKTAVLLLPIAALANTKDKTSTAIWVTVVTFGAYVVLLEDSVDQLYAGYIEAEYQSQGAFIRLAMNAFAAALLLAFWGRFRFDAAEKSLWRWFATISLILLVVLFATSATTAVDRLGLYMLPLQIVVFSSMPDCFGSKRSSPRGWVTLVVGYCFLVQLVWLNYANHAEYWLPYRFLPFEADL